MNNKKNKRKNEKTSPALPAAAEFPLRRVNILTPSNPQEKEAFNSILKLILKEYYVDFHHYRRTTVLRRMTRRIVLNKQKSFSDYHTFIRKNEAEIALLYDDLLLSFTEFFRDNTVFDMLKEKVFPQLAKGRSAKTPYGYGYRDARPGRRSIRWPSVYMNFSKQAI